MDTLYYKNNACKHCGGQPMEFVENNEFHIECIDCGISIKKTFTSYTVDFMYGENIITGQWESTVLEARKIWNKEVDK